MWHTGGIQEYTVGIQAWEKGHTGWAEYREYRWNTGIQHCTCGGIQVAYRHTVRALGIA